MDVAKYTKYYNAIYKTAHDHNLNKQELDKKLNKILSRNNITLDIADQYNCTFLHHAVLNHDIDVVNLLIEEGANVHKRDCFEYTPMHLAAATNNTYIIQLLADNGAYVDEEDWLGCTALHISVFYNNEEAFMLLINIKANVDEVNDEGHTPLHIAVINNNIHMAMLIINAGVDVNAKDIHGHTALYIAVIKGNINIVKLLISARADINTQEYYYTSTPLHITVLDNNLDIATLFIKSKADVNIKDRFHNTPLHYAQIKKNRDMIKLLTAADINKSSYACIHNDSINYVGPHDVNKISCTCAILISPLMIAVTCGYFLGLNAIVAIIGVFVALLPAFIMLCCAATLMRNQKRCSYNENGIDTTEVIVPSILTPSSLMHINLENSTLDQSIC